MADLFTTNLMTRVVQSLILPQTGLLTRYFTEMQQDQTEEIHFDVEKKRRRLAPFVSPLREGKIVEGAGFTTNTFKPAYVKDKRVFDSNRPMKRSIGEQIGGSLDPATRLQMILGYELKDQMEMLTRRQEVMASEALRTGKVTVVGDGYPSVLVDFGRAAGHTVVLSGGARWGQAGVNPLNLLQDWALTVQQACGAAPIDVIMTIDVWKIFRADAEVQKRLDQFRGNSTMVRDSSVNAGLDFKGVIDGFNVFTYADWYIDDNNAEQPILPAGTVIMSSAQVEGVRCYGAIRDEEAGYQALPYFPKSWVEKDPAVRYLLMQSAPLMVPYRVNASFCATVL